MENVSDSKSINHSHSQYYKFTFNADNQGYLSPNIRSLVGANPDFSNKKRRESVPNSIGRSIKSPLNF